MKDITLVLLAAGNSTRFAQKVKKQWIYTDDKPLWLMVASEFECYNFAKIIIVSSLEEIKYMQNFADYGFVAGGDSRQESLKNALTEVETKYVIVNDVARCCIDHDMVSRVIEARELADCIVPTLSINDTVYLGSNPINRDELKIIQTPQLSITNVLTDALNTDAEYTDESSSIVASNHTVHFVQGSHNAHKLTTLDDIYKIPCLKPPVVKMMVGFGIDTHTFDESKTMVLGGVNIDCGFGLKAHSDGDAAIHAIIDALLGAAGMGDIGEYFPDTDILYKGADSKELLKYVVEKIYAFGFEINNIDITIVAQKPKITPHKLEMRKVLASLIEINTQFINIKATTSEDVGFIGRGEGLTVHAVSSLSYKNWSKN
jgi:2-C-methyl-D-erythritol 4-phosphate cytidylyltransferase/2-C-methyl-D-erythritol 2,4-cyclodiphosphate synthase